MRPLAVLLDLALGLAVVLLAVGVAGHYRSQRLELGRVHLTRLDPDTRAVLDGLHDDVFITYYVTGRARMPSHLRRLERDVTDLLAALKAASHGRLDYQIVDPDDDPDLVDYAAHRKVAPLRVRHVTRDSYTEQQIWSTLTIAYGPRTPAMIEGVGPEHLPRLQALIAEHLRALDDPPRPTLALAAPEGFGALRAWLAERGQVIDVDLAGGAPLPEQADLLFWMDPGAVPPARLDELERFLQHGRSVIVAGSTWEPHLRREPDLDLLQLQASGYDAGALLGEFGLRPVEGLVLDERSLPLELEGTSLPAPFRVACIAPNQDFHTLTMEPNGTFVFLTPTPFALDADALHDRGWNPEVLATTSDLSWRQDAAPGDELPLASLAPRFGESVPKQPLIVRLRPTDRWQGDLVALAASSPFRDELFDAPGVAHHRLAQVLVETEAGPDRLVLAQAGIQRAEPLPPLPAGQRLLWRVLVLLLFPALLLGLGWARARQPAPAALRGGRAERGRPVGRLALRGAGVLAVVVAGTLLVHGRLDLTADGRNVLHPTTASLAAATTGDDALTAELVVSDEALLPPALRPPLRRLEGLLDDLSRAGADLRVVRTRPEELDEAGRQALRDAGLEPFEVTSRDEEVTTVKTIWSALRLTAHGQTETLPFADVAAFEHAEFRLAFALWRLSTGRHPHVAFASDVPRLSAAEAHEHYQAQGLMAPTGKDVYSVARQVLEGVDFRVTHVNPRDPVLPDDVDLLVWLQPRRAIGPMLGVLIDHLYRGGSAVLAAQHFVIQSRQYRGSDFQFVYWPQPQSPDVDEYWFPELGLDLVREVLFDERNLPIALESQVNRTQRRDFTTMESALPFLIRAVGANFADSPITAGLGDQAFLFASFFRWDADKLAREGLTVTPLITTSPHAWTYAWKGGWIPDELLAGPPVGADGQPQWAGPLPMAVLVQGQFPWPKTAFERLPVTVGPDGIPHTVGTLPPYPEPEPTDDAAPGRLLFLGCSELFKDGWLTDLQPEFRGDHLLLNAAASMGLPADLAAVMTRRPVARGLQMPAPDERLRWRAGVLLAGPLLLLVLGLLRWLLVRLRRRRVRPVGART